MNRQSPGDAARRVHVTSATLVLLSAIAIVVWVLVDSLPGAPVRPNSDDGYYLHYMQMVHDHGLPAFPGLAKAWIEDQRSWIFPPPSRIGFIVVSALWGGLFGTTLLSLQWLSLASHVAGTIVHYGFARRQFGESNALFIALLWLCSPLLMGLSRLALTDSFNALCGSATVWLFLEFTQKPSSRLRQGLFMAAFGFAVIVKELSVLLAGPFLVFALVERFRQRTPIKLGVLAALFVVPGLIAFPIYACAAGDVHSLMKMAHIVIASPATNTYAIRFGSGPWFDCLIAFMCLSPAPTLLAIGAVFVVFTRSRDGVYDSRLVFMGLVIACLVLEYSLFTKNVRYAVVMELPIRVLAVWMLGELCAGANAVRSTIACAAAVALLCALDYQAFRLFWVQYNLYDPVSHHLLGIRHVIPYVNP
jgi:hypothetical protein